MMMKYFSALGELGTCDTQLLDAVFTMAYHVMEDQGRLDCLAQVPILQMFCELEEDTVLDKLSGVSH